MRSVVTFAILALVVVPRAATATPPVSLARTDFAAASTPFAAATGDVNGDLVPDLAVVNYGANSVSVRLGLGGAFGPPADYAAGLNPVSVAIGDLNSDGIQAGKTYAISVCYRWLDAGNPVLPQYVRFRLTASAVRGTPGPKCAGLVWGSAVPPAAQALRARLSRMARATNTNSNSAPAPKMRSGPMRAHARVRMTWPEVISGLRAYHRPSLTA
jgi:hypothetical protein